VIHQQRKKFAENISHDENKAQHGDSEQHVHDELAANKSIDQLHLLPHTLAQIATAAALAGLSKARQFANINQMMVLEFTTKQLTSVSAETARAMS
jgi:hypothetical protein